MNVLIFGKDGGVGSELVKIYSNDNVTSLGKNDINFLADDSKKKLSILLTKHKPDIIINATGVFGNNDIEYKNIFDVNVKSNWFIIDHYRQFKSNKTIKIIMIGSTAYDHGRKDYILYAASKAALHNIYEGASELFLGSNIFIGLIHPSKINTKMIANLSDEQKSKCLSPEIVAKNIKIFIDKLTKASYIILK
jgi:NAD(P)-dependent dehydrogenase (short-subunit alcohol dehydrogenase family)